jgi:hypothetical protein
MLCTSGLCSILVSAARKQLQMTEHPPPPPQVPQRTFFSHKFPFNTLCYFSLTEVQIFLSMSHAFLQDIKTSFVYTLHVLYHCSCTARCMSRFLSLLLLSVFVRNRFKSETKISLLGHIRDYHNSYFEQTTLNILVNSFTFTLIYFNPLCRCINLLTPNDL